MKFVVIVTIVFIVVAATFVYGAPPSHTKITAAAPATIAGTAADGNSNSHNNFGYVYDTAANVIKRLFNKN